MFTDFGGREREKHQCEGETQAGCLLHGPHRASHPCPSVCGAPTQPLSQGGRSRSFINVPTPSSPSSHHHSPRPNMSSSLVTRV